jgi:hypothetical protein
VVRGVGAARDVLTRHKLGYVLLVTLVVVACGGVLVHSFEQAAPEANIETVPDAL